ncbi:MAG: MmcQ/YjbR family DNA-binding protein [Proteobacteria bacterium]|nr:MmcQ/YjbR family DNA-binding protein [Pseudomonadota bacterium]
MALRLSGVEDGTSYGTPALKVRGKLMARVHQDLDCFVLRTDFLDREILMKSAPHVFFITDHYLNYPWVLVHFGTVTLRELPELLERAWRLVAPKSLLKAREREAAAE